MVRFGNEFIRSLKQDVHKTIQDVHVRMHDIYLRIYNRLSVIRTFMGDDNSSNYGSVLIMEV